MMDVLFVVESSCLCQLVDGLFSEKPYQSSDHLRVLQEDSGSGIIANFMAVERAL